MSDRNPRSGFLRKATMTLAACGVVALMAVGCFLVLDRLYPPPLPREMTVSTEVVDRDGALLRAFATPEGRWRLAVNVDDVDRQFIDMLIACEDKRFWNHSGVDLLALLRAAGQFAGNGRIVSGGSTLSMQLARLLEPRQNRSLGVKIKQIFRAVQIERRLSKREILERYLALAPYGGNLEGIRAASLAWFGKEPRRLSLSESALLVALPQLPEKRRPDRNPEAAEKARNRVLERVANAGLVERADVEKIIADGLDVTRRELPAFAAHAAWAALRNAPSEQRHQLTLGRNVQAGLESVAREAASRLGPKLSVAMILADSRNGEILGEVGSADFFNARRSGWIDMTRIARSPGSTLKPFIYGLAFEEGLVAQETLIEDRPSDFGGYRPKNFDMNYQGDVSVRQALQLSLNVPAISLLDAVGPARLMARFRRAGVSLQLPAGEAPGLAIGLGGAGITLRDLVQLYTGLANGGVMRKLRNGAEAKGETAADSGSSLLSAAAAWQVADMLAGVRPPEGASALGIAYKTGTSYGYRDAWSIGFDGRYVLGVWVGRPDGGPVPGLSGYVSAAPILFEAFARSGLSAVALRGPPPGVFKPGREQLPVTLRRFGKDSDGLVAIKATEPAPRIVFPPAGARIDLGVTTGGPASPLVLKLQGGRAPFRWLANGRPLAEAVRQHTTTWIPDGAGSSTLTVIDAAGRAASVQVVIE